MITLLPSDTEMRWLRDHGKLLCECARPRRVWLAMWFDYQCGRCGKRIVE